MALVASDKANKLISLCTALGALEKKKAENECFIVQGASSGWNSTCGEQVEGNPLSKTGHSYSTNTHLLTIFTLARLGMREKSIFMLHIREL